MANYVKFMRGTPAAYLALATKESDTIYFVYEEQNDYGDLYIGNRKVASKVNDNTESIVKKLNELEDVDVSAGITEGQILSWDSSNGKWKPMTLSVFGGATENKDGTFGLVIAPKQGEQNKFLKGDGTWAELPNLAGLTYKVVTAAEDIDVTAEDANKYIYLVKNGEIYDEYLVVEGKIELIGNSKVNLDDYMTNSDYNSDITNRLNNYIESAVYAQDKAVINGRLDNLEDIVSWKTL